MGSPVATSWRTALALLFVCSPYPCLAQPGFADRAEAAVIEFLSNRTSSAGPCSTFFDFGSAILVARVNDIIGAHVTATAKQDVPTAIVRECFQPLLTGGNTGPRWPGGGKADVLTRFRWSETDGVFKVEAQTPS